MEFRPSAATRRRLRLVLFAAAVIGALIGVYSLVFHLSSDPLADVHAYYDAGARLNAGQPLYDPAADTNAASFYRYPPLLAIVFRPLALLPFAVAAAIWEAFLVVSLVLTLRRLGFATRTWMAVGMLGLPLAWSLAIGQAQV
ncbi:MAG TPA: glycosyltransferase 87 family protein, partial [Candidatus Limnocylindrales bacterium]